MGEGDNILILTFFTWSHMRELLNLLFLWKLFAFDSVD